MPPTAPTVIPTHRTEISLQPPQMTQCRIQPLDLSFGPEMARGSSANRSQGRHPSTGRHSPPLPRRSRGQLPAGPRARPGVWSSSGKVRKITGRVAPGLRRIAKQGPASYFPVYREEARALDCGVGADHRVWDIETWYDLMITEAQRVTDALPAVAAD